MAWREPADLDSNHFSIALPNSRRGASAARKQFISFLRHFGLPQRIVDDLEVVIGEALANAAEHGYRPNGRLRLESRLHDSHIEIAVSDDGHGFLSGPISTAHPEPNSPRGYGLFMMQALVDRMEFRNDGKTVWFLKAFVMTAEEN